MLSAIATMRVCLFALATEAIVPKHGAMKGSQYFIIMMSGCMRLSFRPTLIHEKGFTELTERSILKL